MSETIHSINCSDDCTGVRWPNDEPSIQAVPASCACGCHWVERGGLYARVNRA